MGLSFDISPFNLLSSQDADDIGSDTGVASLKGVDMLTSLPFRTFSFFIKRHLQAHYYTDFGLLITISTYLAVHACIIERSSTLTLKYGWEYVCPDWRRVPIHTHTHSHTLNCAGPC